MTPRTDAERRFLSTATIVGLGLWTLLVTASLAWNISQQYRETYEMAAKEARSHFNKDTALRFWASSHGGVYVPVDEHTPPNPNLAHVIDRDITTPSGRKLTLMNPAYMMRQIMTEYAEIYNVQGKITTFPDKLLNPVNMPDAWELAALHKFEAGADEIFEVADIDGEPFLRLMRPMHINDSCLKCHAKQGYKVGQLRGGIGVSVPMKPYVIVEEYRVTNLILSHALIWVIGSGFGLFTARRAFCHQAEQHETHKQLEHAKESAEAANQHKSMFLAHMSHELRTPLNAIIGFSQMMSGKTFGELSAQYREYADLIERSGQHLLETINQILDLSKIEANMMTLEEEDVYMGNLVEEVFTLLTSTAQSNNVSLVNATQELHTLYVDPLRIKQTLFNIIGNAIKFTDNGKVTVSNRSNEDGHEIVVKDTGIGMTDEEVKIAMEPFRQAQNQVYTREIQGTGLGLSLSEHIMSMHGGHLTVKSTKGAGTEVILHFPKSRERAHQAPPTNA